MPSDEYSSGKYFEDPNRHSKDAKFKADNFLNLFLDIARQHELRVTSYIDVGCGSGHIVRIVADSLKARGFDLTKVKGYDVSPHVKNLSDDEILFVHGDFCESNEFPDLVTLFDVFEHVTDPLRFLRLVSERCKIMGLHIPLDYSFNTAIRNLFNSDLKDPGHLIFMDIVSALNILTLAGLRIIEYRYTFSFLAPSGHSTTLSRIALPFRILAARANPWLLSKTLGGASLMVIAATESGTETLQF